MAIRKSPGGLIRAASHEHKPEGYHARGEDQDFSGFPLSALIGTTSPRSSVAGG
ncbi:hypothetical protein [Candidatus Amarolinea dominans]|uniref:hypothetical protein n=1 Tax=Candidatus Amarolinea dominans TaxID=3140696 RepID=UPI001D51EC5A|nr:hypothetical protein [Anaerolineae bacterium]